MFYAKVVLIEYFRNFEKPYLGNHNFDIKISLKPLQIGLVIIWCAYIDFFLLSVSVR